MTRNRTIFSHLTVALFTHARCVIALIALCMVTSCATSVIMLDRAVVRNEMSGPIRDVSVQHEPTNAVGRVSTILPRAELDLGFSRQPLKGKRAIVTWTEPGGAPRRAQLVLSKSHLQVEKKPDRTFTLVYTIQPDGTVSVHLEP